MTFLVLVILILQIPALKEFSSSGKPVWGTCAGLIFLADRALGKLQHFHFMALSMKTGMVESGCMNVLPFLSLMRTSWKLF